ncbi:hypothetical protein FEF26_09620 [Nesterenkonia salmonea]|uniref:Pilus assembly protein n=1 Tax=Nesterenkonia salmonea TaxID=1804987 RepID=A0A5R9B9P7_9MICC|nr:hypothetical protein [Nesterenkonia salmonea]TLP96038.1 hypothetical protein FEF26_09620 [Nesterenkonia salmonea]
MNSSEDSEEGSAIVEFLALAVMLLIPSVWFLIGVSQIQAATYAAVGAADQATKMYIGSEAQAETRAQRSEAAVHAALADFNISPDQATITRTCSEDCEQPGSLVRYEIDVRVPLPLVPEFGGWNHSLVSVSASSTGVQGE